MTDSPPLSASLPESLTFTYVPRPGLLKIAFVNFVLMLVTLTIYRFWAKTNVRKHIWSCIHINGEPLEYTGTGKELFLGFLVVFGCFILPFIILQKGLQIYLGDNDPVVLAVSMLFLLFVYSMIGFALYRARKYQLSRTQWRGIRGNLVGSAMTYSLTYFGSILAKTFSFGWATPVMNTVLQEQIISDMRFGDAAFKFKGRAGPLYPTYALCWFLTLFAAVAAIAFVSYETVTLFGNDIANVFEHIFRRPEDQEPTKSDLTTFGMIMALILGVIAIYLIVVPMLWAIYTAKEMQTFANYTRFDGAQFKLNATALSLIWLTISNILLFIITLTIARPFIVQRTVRYMFDRLSLEGAIDVERIQQSQAAMPTRGEGLADAFELGAW
jgi:uncharacterized membrane protein YjgN (DUF898 family)